MNLKELLERITPLPWDGFKPSAQNVTREEFVANDAYTIHAANVLPDLLKAAKHLADCEDEAQGFMCKECVASREAIQRAEQIEVKD